ncbi:hypothetical protein V5H16_16690 [Vibrio cholerae]|uniref:hypothetical protein n=1 Tax=Vibrio cholerae TaxID=666 RepID=UPI00330ABB47|nr:hypothetical protein [Vibrio cholerae]EGR2127714.1 hypothetical protein [Vibrio cholerae]EKF9231221.1 hypothetical protein [Vibrio cholerae]HDL9506263.1 hypothetical protein [Vibrio cholerae]
MNEFISKTLEPAVFWNALAAVSTLLAIVISLFYPWYTKFVEKRNILKLVCEEIRWNHERLIKIIDCQLPIKDRELPISEVKVWLCALVDEMSNVVWEQYKYQLATIEPRKFYQLKCFYMHYDYLISMKEMPESAQFVSSISADATFMLRIIAQYKWLKKEQLALYK